jgi:CheY-like chemotaxis protein
MNQPGDRAMPRIMLVEDHAQLRAVLERVLGSLGYRVRSVSTGDEALQALQSGETVDLVFSDVRMPGRTDGLALANWVRQNRPQIRVLLQSGYAEVQTSDFVILHKPYTDTELIDALHEALHT